MVGSIIIIVILVLAPIGILLSSSIFAAVFTGLLNRDVAITHEGTELADEAGVPRAVVESLHPVVRRHPETGRPALFVNGNYTKSFEGMTRDESQPLLDFLCAQGCRNEYTWRHHWRVGDLLFWDNASVQHAVVADVGSGERSLHRVTIEGEPPI